MDVPEYNMGDFIVASQDGVPHDLSEVDIDLALDQLREDA